MHPNNPMRKPEVVMLNAEFATSFGKMYLIGEVYGHPEHKAGRTVTTTTILKIRMNNRIVDFVETENTIYLIR